MEKLIMKKENVLINNIKQEEKVLIYKRSFAPSFLLKIKQKKRVNFCLLLSIFIFLLSYLLYYLSLEKCFEGQILCSKKNKWIKIKLTEAICFSIFLSCLIELIILKIIY